MVEFLSSHSLFIVLVIALVVWLGIYLYLFRLDKQVKSLESEMKRKT